VYCFKYGKLRYKYKGEHLELYHRSADNSRVLIFSQRKLENGIFRCSDYEFEDTICSLDAADIFTPEYNGNINRIRYLKFLLNGMLRKQSAAPHIHQDINSFFLEKEYDLFYAHCIFAKDLIALNSLKDWRKKCKKAVCYIAELWTKDLNRLKETLHLLNQFDYILLSCSSSVDAVKGIVQRPCYYFPPGVDAIKFCPFPAKPHRCIDILSIGRRSPKTHKSLINLVEQGKIFYVYDTAKFCGTNNPIGHRSMLSNLIKRSRFFLAYPAKVDLDERGGQEVLGYRYFEGAAGGAVLLGSVPDCEYTEGVFDWPNALISLTYGAGNMDEVMAELDEQSDRITSMRRKNVVTSLLQHDWAYRWRQILDLVGMKPKPALEDREERLKGLADAISSESNDIF
jgi:hypothetical protein